MKEKISPPLALSLLLGILPYLISCSQQKDHSYAKKLFQEKQCIACHSIDGRQKSQGPTLKGIFGKTVVVLTKDKKQKKIKRDIAYLKRAIRNPQAEIVKGYNQIVMPTYGKDQLSDKDVQALIEYIQSLK
ncbi:MAG: cytochrome c [Planctomycetota bacterium]|nr:MAG: cytochrome c [Planctomycetota bacterium]